MMKGRFKPLTLVVMVAFSAGCTMVGPDFVTPDSKTPEAWSKQQDQRINVQADEHRDWWKAFNDPALNALIENAYESNLQLQVAGLRILESRAILGRVEGFIYPQSQNLGANVSRIKLSENAEPISNLPSPISEQFDDSFTNYGIGLDAAWELDFWGKYRRAIESADANLAASVANYDDVLITLTGDVASAYITLRSLQERLDIARRNVVVQARSLEIAQVRFDQGITTELDVQQAKSLLFNTESLIPLIDTQIVKTKNALSILLGRPPENLAEILGRNDMLPKIPTSLNVGVPGELLRRRPDVRRAEMQAATSSAQIGVAKADFYPSFQLLGSVGYVADSTGDLISSDSVAGIGGFGFMWKFLNYGRIENQVRINDARFQQAITAYQLTVLAAAQEVDDALVSFINSQTEREKKAASAKAAERAVQLAMTQYRDGVTDYTTVLDTQRIQLAQQDALVAAKSKMGLQLIAAYRALGGGWQLRENKGFVPDAVKQQMLERTDWGELMQVSATSN